jgi:hypothetical protein
MAELRRTAALVLSAVALGAAPACGEDDVREGARDAEREAEQTGRDAEREAEEAKKEAEEAAQDAERELEK